MVKSLSAATLSALISFSGDYKAQVQFDGPVRSQIAGQLVDTSDYTSDKSCEWQARFQEVLYKKQRHIKLNLTSRCLKPQSAPPEYLETILHPEYIRLKDLKMDSTTTEISKEHKNVQIKVLDLKF